MTKADTGRLLFLSGEQETRSPKQQIASGFLSNSQLNYIMPNYTLVNCQLHVSKLPITR